MESKKIDNPKFTAYALGELEANEAQAFRKELVKSGISEVEIEENMNSIKLVSQTLNKEFKKDDTVRVPPQVRESMFSVITQENNNVFKWIVSGLSGACVAVLAVIIYLENDPAVMKLGSHSEQNSTNSNKVKRSKSVYVKTPWYTSPKKASTESTTNATNPLNDAATKSDSSKAKKRVKNYNFNKASKFSAMLGKTMSKSSNDNLGSHPKSVVNLSTHLTKRDYNNSSAGISSNHKMGLSSTAGAGQSLRETKVRNTYERGTVLTRGKHENANRETYDKIDANPYVLVDNQPLSTFSVDVDTASYSNMRRFLLKGNIPPKNSLRVEELINYFHYDYNLDFKKHPIAVKVDQTDSIWTKGRKIVRIALKASSPSKLTSAPKNLVFLLDVSGSMDRPKKLPLLKESMKILLRKLKKEDTVSLVVYAGAAGVVLEPTEVREKLKILKALDRLDAGGSTNGGEGIRAAYKMAKQGFIKNGVNRIILATDGDFNVGTSSDNELLELIESKSKEDIFLTVVGLGMGNYQDAILERISNRGNGNYAYIDSLSEANKLFNIDLEKNLTTVAKDVKVQIEFNPKLVKGYRLIGYENRMLRAQDFNNDEKDAGEMGAGHTVTALYEIVPINEKMDELPKIDKLKYSQPLKVSNNANELLTVKTRYKYPTGTKSIKFEVPLKKEKKKFDSADQDFRFATAVASFGMKLRGDKLVKELSYKDIESMAKNAKGKDPFDFRTEFIEMIDLSRQIDN